VPLRITTWNVNSVRLRLDGLARLAEMARPDVFCLQETKVTNDLFPCDELCGLGYPHQLLHGQPGYHGVAILSKIPLEGPQRLDWCDKADCRHAMAVLPGDIELHNLYVPAGGDEPDPEINVKFAHKLAFLDEMVDWFTADMAAVAPPAGAVILGDLNIAPLEDDVWSHKQLLKVVSHTPVEVERLERVRASLGWVDVVRRDIPPPDKLYTWWSYRARDWDAVDKGRRLDHVWLSPGFEDACTGVEVLRAARGWDRPSDHVPVIVELAT
jgi:exodeoxyribonuclease-3